MRLEFVCTDRLCEERGLIGYEPERLILSSDAIDTILDQLDDAFLGTPLTDFAATGGQANPVFRDIEYHTDIAVIDRNNTVI